MGVADFAARSLTPSGSDEARIDRLVRFAGARPDQAISVAGRGGPDLMVALCRRGFQRVECARQATCRCADQAGDVLIVGGGTATESLVSVVQRTVRLLKDGGILAVELGEIDDDCAVQACLAAQGLDAASTVFDLTDGVRVAHTVRRRPARPIAA